MFVSLFFSARSALKRDYKNIDVRKKLIKTLLVGSLTALTALLHLATSHAARCVVCVARVAAVLSAGRVHVTARFTLRALSSVPVVAGV